MNKTTKPVHCPWTEYGQEIGEGDYVFTGEVLLRQTNLNQDPMLFMVVETDEHIHLATLSGGTALYRKASNSGEGGALLKDLLAVEGILLSSKLRNCGSWVNLGPIWKEDRDELDLSDYSEIVKLLRATRDISEHLLKVIWYKGTPCVTMELELSKVSLVNLYTGEELYRNSLIQLTQCLMGPRMSKLLGEAPDLYKFLSKEFFSLCD